MDTERYRQDHREINAQIQSLRLLISAGVSVNSQAIFNLVNSIGVLVVDHLEREDNELYLSLAMSSDAKLSAIAIDVQIRMGEIREAFEEFCDVYSSPAKLATNQTAFRQDASAVFKVLHDRMRFENNELFPLLASIDKP